MQEQSDDEILNEWNPGTDMIVTLLSDKIKHLQEQENLERERMDVTAGNINQNQLQTDNCNLTMTMCQVDVLRDVLNTYLSEMAERSQASTEQRKKKRLTLIEQVAVFLQYKKIIAMTQIPEINLSFGSGTNGATKLNGQELMLLNSVNAVVNPVINFTENEQVRLRRLQASVEHGMRIVNDSRMRVISQHTGHDIKRLLDRVSNCDLLGKMPFWLENMNFIREMPFPPPARAVRCSASSFAIGGRTPDCSFDDQNSIYPGAKRTSLGQIKTTKQRFQYSVEPKSNGGLTENDELKMKTVDAKLNVQQNFAQYRMETPSAKSVTSVKPLADDCKKKPHVNIYCPFYFSSLCIGLILGFSVCKACKYLVQIYFNSCQSNV